MLTRPVETSDELGFASWYRVLRDADLSGRVEGAPFFSQREAEVIFSGADPSEDVKAYAAFDGDTMCAAGFSSLPLLDNTDKALVYLAVPPDRRRRGIGGAMLADLVDRVLRAGRTAILTECNVPAGQEQSHGFRRFAEKHGFSYANTEIRRELSLPVPEDALSAWAAEATPHHVGYSITTYVDDVPRRLLGSLCHVRNQLSLDAPTGDIELEAEAMTPDVFLQRQAMQRDMGLTTYWTLATDARGETVAFTCVGIPADPPDLVYQWGTVVLRDHRGHRLGLAVKTANLAAVQADHPERTRVSTQNAETNAPMVAINEKMGFRPLEVVLEFQQLTSAHPTEAAADVGSASVLA
jgi:GNAT superfamily N-acetyltransferase/RimJ/RimL family protein N-acetyltransferase